jgi:hypothetical protein
MTSYWCEYCDTIWPDAWHAAHCCDPAAFDPDD